MSTFTNTPSRDIVLCLSVAEATALFLVAHDGLADAQQNGREAFPGNQAGLNAAQRAVFTLMEALQQRETHKRPE